MGSSGSSTTAIALCPEGSSTTRDTKDIDDGTECSGFGSRMSGLVIGSGTRPSKGKGVGMGSSGCGLERTGSD